MTINSDRTNRITLRLLACFQAGQVGSEALIQYAKQINSLLNGQLDQHHFHDCEPATLANRSLSSYNLILLNEAGAFKEARAYQTRQNSSKSKPALLLARKPKWPLQKLLLIIRGEATDKITLDWGTMLARLTCCKITTLVVIPPGFRMRPSTISRTLQPDTLHGRHIRQALENFAAHQIDGIVKFSYRDPYRQLQQEINAKSYDLVVLGSEPPGRMFAWRLDSLLAPLLEWTKQSFLVTGAVLPPIFSPEILGEPA